MTRVILLRALVLTALVCSLFGAQSERAIADDLQSVLSKYNTTLYGRVKTDINYDTAEFKKYNDFVGAVGAGDDVDNNSVNFNPRDTRFGFIASRDEEDWVSTARIEVDFYGDNAGNNLIPRMRLGYVKAEYKPSDFSVVVGQDWIPIAALNPPTVDFGILTAAGNLWWRVPQVTFRKGFSDNYEVLFSAMKHRRIDTAEESRLPWLVTRVAYNDSKYHFALGGGWRTEDVEGSTGIEESVQRWLAALEMKAKYGAVTVLAEPWIGQGIDNEFLRYDLGVNTALPTPEEVFAWGGFVAVSVAAGERTTISGGYGIDNPDEDDLEGIEFNDRQFEMNQQAFVNLWYNLTSAIKVGGEVLYVATDRPDFDNDGFRFTTSAIMSF